MVLRPPAPARRPLHLRPISLKLPPPTCAAPPESPRASAAPHAPAGSRRPARRRGRGRCGRGRRRVPGQMWGGVDTDTDACAAPVHTIVLMAPRVHAPTSMRTPPSPSPAHPSGHLLIGGHIHGCFCGHAALAAGRCGRHAGHTRHLHALCGRQAGGAGVEGRLSSRAMPAKAALIQPGRPRCSALATPACSQAHSTCCACTCPLLLTGARFT